MTFFLTLFLKQTPDNVVLYSFRLGGNSDDYVTDIKFGNDGNVYFAGYSISSNLPTTGISTRDN